MCPNPFFPEEGEYIITIFNISHGGFYFRKIAPTVRLHGTSSDMMFKEKVINECPKLGITHNMLHKSNLDCRRINVKLKNNVIFRFG